jgi:hypothetical protein
VISFRDLWHSWDLKHYFAVNGFRLIKDFDRGIKDEGAGNPEEVNKQLNDEKQSMVNTQNPFFGLTYVGNLVFSSSNFGRGS